MWHTHNYKVSVKTGSKPLKGAKLKMTLIGDAGQTGPRPMEDGKRTVTHKTKGSCNRLEPVVIYVCVRVGVRACVGVNERVGVRVGERGCVCMNESV